MIVKTFVGQDAKEIEGRIFQNYGPDAIILTSIEVAPNQIEVSFGVEEHDFVAHQKKMRSPKDADFFKLLHEDEQWRKQDAFWDEETIPDIDYAESGTGKREQ